MLIFGDRYARLAAAWADTPTLDMWWWGEQELPGLQGFVTDSVQHYTAATVKPMSQDTAVVTSQFQTAAAAAAGKASDVQYLWNGIYHMESVWLGYLRPLNGLVRAVAMSRSIPRVQTKRGSPERPPMAAAATASVSVG